MHNSHPDGLHARVVLQLPLRWVRNVLVVKVTATSLSPADGLHLGMTVEEDGVVGEKLPEEVEEGAVESEPESPIDLHFSLLFI